MWKRGQDKLPQKFCSAKKQPAFAQVCSPLGYKPKSKIPSTDSNPFLHSVCLKTQCLKERVVVYEKSKWPMRRVQGSQTEKFGEDKSTQFPESQPDEESFTTATVVSSSLIESDRKHVNYNEEEISKVSTNDGRHSQRLSQALAPKLSGSINDAMTAKKSSKKKLRRNSSKTGEHHRASSSKHFMQTKLPLDSHILIVKRLSKNRPDMAAINRNFESMDTIAKEQLRIGGDEGSETKMKVDSPVVNAEEKAAKAAQSTKSSNSPLANDPLKSDESWDDQGFDPNLSASTLPRENNLGNGEKPESSSPKSLAKEGHVASGEEILNEEQSELSNFANNMSKKNYRIKSQPNDAQNMLTEDDKAYAEPVSNQEESESELKSSSRSMENDNQFTLKRKKHKEYEDKAPIPIKPKSNSNSSIYTDTQDGVRSSNNTAFNYSKGTVVDQRSFSSDTISGSGIENIQGKIDYTTIYKPAEAVYEEKVEGEEEEEEEEEEEQGAVQPCLWYNSGYRYLPFPNSFGFCCPYYYPTRRMCRCNKFMTWPARSKCNGPSCFCNGCCSRNR